MVLSLKAGLYFAQAAGMAEAPGQHTGSAAAFGSMLSLSTVESTAILS